MRNDWIMVNFKDVCKTITPPKKIHTKYFYSKGQYPIIDQSQNEIAGWTDDEEAIININYPVVVFGDHTCAIKYVDQPFAQGADGIKILKFHVNLIPKLLYFFFQYKRIKGKGYRRHFSKLKENKIPLLPLPEQQAIVQKIKTVFKFIDKSKKELESAKEKLKIYRQSLLKKAFEGRLLNKKELEICRKRKDWKSASQLLKDINSKAEYTPSKTHKDWLIVQLGDVTQVISGQSPKSKYYNENEKGLPFYQGKTEFRKIYLGKPTKWTKSITKIAIPNDILMSVRAPVGPVNITKRKICIGRGLSAIRVEIVNQMFIFYFLKKNQSKIIGGGGSVFNSINQQSIKQIKIPLAPLPEQQAIVQKIESIFSHCEKTETYIKQNLQNISLLRQSIFKKAFSGKFLTRKELGKCRKAPDWKSATELLAQIQKEKFIIKTRKSKSKNKRKAI